MYEKMKETIASFEETIKSDKLRKLFENCFYNTLDTTIEYLDDGSVYMLTGDIPAMWLRDSSASVLQYIEFAKEDEDVFNLTWDEKEERTKTSTTRKMYERSEDKISESKIDKTTDKEKEFFGKRIVNFLKKCYNRCKNFITKIRKITNKMEMIGDLLEDEDIIDAVKRIKRYGVNGVKLLLPQKLNAKIIFGFEDPYYTGKVLGWTAALIPIYGDHINITPDFEKRILKGELKIKGRIRRYKILYLLWKVYKDKDELIKQKDRAIRMIGGS